VARTARIEASLTGPLRFTVAAGRDLSAVDELRLHQDFGIVVAGEEVPLGTGDVLIGVEVTRVEEPDAEGMVAVAARPRRRDIVFVLDAPPRRRLPARRTQPPSPRPGRSPATEHQPALPIVARASQSVETVLRAVTDRPLLSASSSAALLDDLRGERA